MYSVAFKKHEYIFAISVISRHWGGVGSWNVFLMEVNNLWYITVKVMIFDVLTPDNTRSHDIDLQSNL